MSTIAERVRKVIIDHLADTNDEIAPEKVTDTASLVGDLGCDSLDLVELVMAFEEEFDIEISDDRTETIRTVGDAIKLVDELRAVPA